MQLRTCDVLLRWRALGFLTPTPPGAGHQGALVAGETDVIPSLPLNRTVTYIVANRDPRL